MTIVRKKKFFKALAVCTVALMFSASTLIINAEAASVAYPDVINAEAASVAYPDGDASATGVNSTAVGSGANAEGNLSTAVGNGAHTDAQHEGTAVGYNAQTSGYQATASGSGAQATAMRGTATCNRRGQSQFRFRRWGTCAGDTEHSHRARFTSVRCA